MTRTAIASAVFVLGAVAALAEPCSSSSTALCLSASRFEVNVSWKDFQGNTGSGQAVSLTPDTGYFWFFSASNVELIVKVLDARAINGKFWVFFGALSNVQYDMTVKDTATGGSKTYHNPSGQFASVGDTSAFEGGSGVTATRETVTIAGDQAAPESLAAIQRFVGAAAASASAEAQADFAPCLGPVTDLYLSNCRFKLEASWQDSHGNTGGGQAVQLTSDTGYFWFFSPTNVELVVKALDARAVNGDFWVFYGALSNVQYRITVTDTLSGDVKVYTNPQGTFASVGDTSAFQPGPSVAAVRNDALAVSGRFDRTGGTLTATGSDGTNFILTLPQDALIFPVRITMTPVSAVSGVALGGPLLAAVQIEPDGLFLWEQADLKIVPPTAPDVKNLTYFRYRGSGESFTPYPGVNLATGIEMPVSYLAGYGAATHAFSGSIRSLERVWHLEASGALAPYIAGAADLWQQNNNDKFPSEDAYLSQVYQVWSDAWTNVVQPALNGLGDNCDLVTLRSVFQMAMEFRELDPETDPNWGSYNDEIFKIMKQKVFACIDLAYQRCKSDNDPSQVMLMTKLETLLQRVGLVSDAENQEIYDKIDKCLRFEIDFESGLTVGYATDGVSLTERLKVRAIVPVQLEAIDNKFILSGSAEIRHEFVDVQGPPCTYAIATSPSAFTVHRLDIGIFDTDGAADRQDISVDMIYEPGNPEEQMTQTCPVPGLGNVVGTGPFQGVFEPFYAALHQDEEVPGTGGQYIVIHWEPIRSGSIFAKLQYVRSETLEGTVPTSEETYIFLKHTPQ